MTDIVLRIALGVIGIALILRVLLSAVRTLVLPRSANDPVTSFVFRQMSILFALRRSFARNYKEIDGIMALYAPIAILSLVVAWLALTLIGYTAIYRALGVTNWRVAILLSGSSIFTLGTTPAPDFLTSLVAFSEAAIGLALLALLIGFLPTIYTAWSRREAQVTMLEVRAGSPPSAVELISRYHRLGRFDHLHDLWETWEAWFADIDETHTSLAMLSFFRSPQSHRSWVIAAGAILDAASLTIAALDIPADAQAALCIRAGYIALHNISDFFEIRYNHSPTTSGDPISVTREEFDAALAALAREGVPLKPDHEQAWRDFQGWRVNYDFVLLQLANLTLSPPAPWSSDRTPPRLTIRQMLTRRVR